MLWYCAVCYRAQLYCQNCQALLYQVLHSSLREVHSKAEY
ncbi:hypothetical protein XBJ1_4051 [Xenorhabdus bovienii SS-2004]|uniref:Uncharacterized protein n=1 Tax=Xenorhabdus bovienii (strain SS-2004) TaxID=406818 RepID=D3V684_XENBS|nr:hypothetical protein XBJ1_4051 [Xenorhabdus bovienii SS-2004]